MLLASPALLLAFILLADPRRVDPLPPSTASLFVWIRAALRAGSPRSFPSSPNLFLTLGPPLGILSFPRETTTATTRSFSSRSYGAYTGSNFHYVNSLPNAGLGPLSNLPLFFVRSEPLFLGLALRALVLHPAYFLLTPSHNHPDFHAHIDIHVYTYSLPPVLRVCMHSRLHNPLPLLLTELKACSSGGLHRWRPPEAHSFGLCSGNLASTCISDPSHAAGLNHTVLFNRLAQPPRLGPGHGFIR